MVAVVVFAIIVVGLLFAIPDCNGNTNGIKWWFWYHFHVESYLIKFLLRILGALTAAPTSDDPVNQIPHAAPTTDNPKPKAMPKLAYP